MLAVSVMQDIKQQVHLEVIPHFQQSLLLAADLVMSFPAAAAVQLAVLAVLAVAVLQVAVQQLLALVEQEQ